MHSGIGYYAAFTAGPEVAKSACSLVPTALENAGNLLTGCQNVAT